jgi:hypothetical protein
MPEHCLTEHAPFAPSVALSSGPLPPLPLGVHQRRGCPPEYRKSHGRSRLRALELPGFRAYANRPEARCVRPDDLSPTLGPENGSLGPRAASRAKRRGLPGTRLSLERHLRSDRACCPAEYRRSPCTFAAFWGRVPRYSGGVEADCSGVPEDSRPDRRCAAPELRITRTTKLVESPGTPEHSEGLSPVEYSGTPDLRRSDTDRRPSKRSGLSRYSGAPGDERYREGGRVSRSTARARAKASREYSGTPVLRSTHAFFAMTGGGSAARC